MASKRKQIINPYIRFTAQKAQGPYASQLSGGVHAKSFKRRDTGEASFLLQESGDKILLENSSGAIILES